jgi:hypothetical protein
MMPPRRAASTRRSSLREPIAKEEDVRHEG